MRDLISRTVTDKTMNRRDALRITAVAGVSAAVGGSWIAELIRAARLHRVSETRTRMGTLVTITTVHPDGDEARRMVAAAFAEMERLEGILSRHSVESALGRLNRDGRLTAPPPELHDVLHAARSFGRASSGAFDVTIAPLLHLYEGAAEQGRRMPTPAELAPVLALVDFEGVSVTPDEIRFAHPDMRVTLDGIGKGYIVDRTIAVLTALGSDRVLVDAGGDMATAGPGSESEPWTIAIQDPHGESATAGLVRLAGDCIATSGDYMRTFTEDRVAHHIIDPRTGTSPSHTSSVTVMAPTAIMADALSTAVLVLGPEAGIDFLESRTGAEGMLVSKDGVRFRTSGFAARVT